MSDSLECPLCSDLGSEFFTDTKDSKVYFRCNFCELVWMHPDCRVNSEDELAHYKRHNNNPDDSRYRDFLNNLWQPLKEQLSPDAEGLDYGSGPGPTLHLMAKEDGFDCAHYDPYFHPDTAALHKSYDFITCSETAEHFYHPNKEFSALAKLLKPGGWLGFMTTRYDANTDFRNWHYRHDPTHVAFYTDRTFEIMADRLNFDFVKILSNRVVLLKYSSDSAL